jgi:formate hydrogenlyase subunit 3/multisubunit Na+/H+ antiporter MnhD subunit
MRRWPWITMILTGILALSPFGCDVFYLAFLSGEQLSRNIWQSLYLIAVAIMIALIALEWSVRTFVSRRRARKAKT